MAFSISADATARKSLKLFSQDAVCVALGYVCSPAYNFKTSIKGKTKLPYRQKSAEGTDSPLSGRLLA